MEFIMLDKRQAAKELGISVNGLDNLRSDGEIKFVTIGNRVKFNASEIAKFMKLERREANIEVEHHNLSSKIYHLFEQKEERIKEHALLILESYVEEAEILIEDYDYDNAAGKLEYAIEHLLSIDKYQIEE